MVFKRKNKVKLTTLILALVLVSENAFCREPNPPEVQALIGMKIPPRTKMVRVTNKQTGETQEMEKMAPGVIPGFTDVGGEMLAYSKDSYAIGLKEGFIHKIPVFVVDRLDYKNFNLKIVDAQALPPELLEWRLVAGKIDYVSGRYRLSADCEFKDKTKDVSRYVRLLGLVKPEKGKTDCAHNSDQVKQAWGIDGRNSRIESIPTEGLKCAYITMDDC